MAQVVEIPQKGLKWQSAEALRVVQDAFNAINNHGLEIDVLKRVLLNDPRIYKLMGTLTAKDEFAPGMFKYAWEERKTRNVTLETPEEPRSGTVSENYALNLVELNGLGNTTGMALNQVVVLWCVVDPDGLAQFIFEQTPPGPGCPCAETDANGVLVRNEVGEDNEAVAAMTDSWAACEGFGLVITQVTRLSYDHTESDPQFYAFYRIFTYSEDGRLCSVSPETRVTIDDTEPC